MKLRIRSFWAPDDVATSKRFVEGHNNVLREIGVKKVTSSQDDWIDSPLVYVYVCENEEGEVVGGARLHIAQPDHPLPMEKAISKVDPTIREHVGKHIDHGCAELCGLWNSKEIAGRGIGVRFLPIAAIASSANVGIGSIFALVAKHTLKQSLKLGFSKFPQVGDEGEFNYPKIDLIATAVLIESTDPIQGIQRDRDLNMMLNLRKSKTFEEEVRWPRGTFDLSMAIDIQPKWKKELSNL